jgi:hypothetical protein
MLIIVMHAMMSLKRHVLFFKTRSKDRCVTMCCFDVVAGFVRASPRSPCLLAGADEVLYVVIAAVLN